MKLPETQETSLQPFKDSLGTARDEDLGECASSTGLPGDPLKRMNRGVLLEALARLSGTQPFDAVRGEDCSPGAVFRTPAVKGPSVA